MSPKHENYSYSSLPTSPPHHTSSHHRRERLYKQILHRKGKLTTASSFSQMFAKFSMLCLVELKFDQSSIHKPDPTLVTIYVIVTSIFIAHTVILHLALCHIETSLHPVIALSNHSIQQFDFGWIPFQSLFFSWDAVYVIGICGGFFLFSLCFILLLWIKFAQYGKSVPLAGFIFMGPVLLIVIIYGIVLYVREKKRRREDNQEEDDGDV